MDKITDEEKNKIPTYKDSVGIRATLNSYGIPNKKIGYDEATKTVTIGGKDFMKPSYMDEDMGISYAPESAIRENLVSFYSDSKTPIVRVSDYFSEKAGKYGLDAGALTYGNGRVMIGGRPLNALYIDDEGKAWAWQNDVEDSVNEYVNSLGLKNPNKILSSYNSEYLDDIYTMLNEIYNRDAFSYSPENDPAYKSYKKQYISEGNRATRDALAQQSALTGGHINSSAVTAGALTNQYYAQQLSNKIPELFDAAYERYKDSYDTDLNLVSRMLSAYDSGLGYALSANQAAVGNANETIRSVTQRDKDAKEANWSDMERWQKYILNENEDKRKDQANQQSIKESESTINLNSLKTNELSILLEYYRKILDADLRKTEADIYSAYYK